MNLIDDDWSSLRWTQTGQGKGPEPMVEDRPSGLEELGQPLLFAQLEVVNRLDKIDDCRTEGFHPSLKSTPDPRKSISNCSPVTMDHRAGT